MSHDWLPRRREEIIAMARTWKAVLTEEEGRWDVTTGEVSGLNLRLNNAVAALNEAEANKGDRHLNAVAKEAMDTLIAYMRVLRRRRFIIPPLAPPDFVLLGMREPDLTHTPHIEVTEAVELELSLRNIREVLVEFKVKGAANKAKPAGYDGAVIVWDVLDAPPANPNDLTRHTMASRTPHALIFDQEERGKTVYVCAAWQNERGNIGLWSDILSGIVP